jgi:hypothetical protein
MYDLTYHEIAKVLVVLTDYYCHGFIDLRFHVHLAFIRVKANKGMVA